MPPETSTPIVAAARRRHELTRAKAVQALRQLDAVDARVTFQAVAHAAGVSRSWLYAQPDIRRDIERLREATHRSPARSVITTQRPTDASLTVRLHAANQRIRELNEDNQRLRRQLAHALGDLRAAGRSRTGGQPSAAPRDNTSTTIRAHQP